MHFSRKFLAGWAKQLSWEDFCHKFCHKYPYDMLLNYHPKTTVEQKYKYLVSCNPAQYNLTIFESIRKKLSVEQLKEIYKHTKDRGILEETKQELHRRGRRVPTRQFSIEP